MEVSPEEADPGAPDSWGPLILSLLKDCLTSNTI